MYLQCRWRNKKQRRRCARYATQGCDKSAPCESTPGIPGRDRYNYIAPRGKKSDAIGWEAEKPTPTHRCLSFVSQFCTVSFSLIGSIACLAVVTHRQSIFHRIICYKNYLRTNRSVVFYESTSVERLFAPTIN